MPLPVAVPVGEQIGPAATAPLESSHDLVHGRVGNDEQALLVGLADVVKADRAALAELHVAFEQGGQPEGAVLVGIGLAADAEEPQVEQADGAGQDALAREPTSAEGLLGDAPYLGEAEREVEHAVELLAVAALTPLLVVEVLPAAGRVGAARLQVAVRPGRDPHVTPGGRDH